MGRCPPSSAMFSFFRDVWELGQGRAPTLFMIFFVYVWVLWGAKALAARRHCASTHADRDRRTSVIVPVYNESEAAFRRALASVVANRPPFLIGVVSGGDAELAEIAADSCAPVVRLPRCG